MNLSGVRQSYLNYFKDRGHEVVPSASLVPENDPTTLFTSSGMQPMLPYLLGEKHPLGERIVDSQKCFRAGDIDEVGDNRHTTFFEMLGNWSLGDYFKEEQLTWFFEYLTDVVGLDPRKLYVSVFAGDEKLGIPRDDESVVLWQKLFASKGIDAQAVDIGSEENGARVGMQGGRIFYYDASKNWWSRSGVPKNMPVGEPGGPDSEVFYEFDHIEHDNAFGEHCHPNCDCGRYMEIGNSVFMVYKKVSDEGFEELAQKNVDFGGGLERITAAAANESDMFRGVDVLSRIVEYLEHASGEKYADDTRSFRVIADHMRAAVFMIGDGVEPSNTDQGYLLRRLLRRSIMFADTLTVPSENLVGIVEIVADAYANAYPQLAHTRARIASVVKDEEEKFRATLKQGMKEFEKVVAEADVVSGENAFLLFTTYGFPLELTQELAQERGIDVDIDGYEKRMEEHRELSRSGSEQKFKGGLADHSDMSVRYHTATHLLNAALREVLGEHVQQRGSNITPERLRFDFSHDEKLTPEEKDAVENWVNDKIQKGLRVEWQEMDLEDARSAGALGVFGEKYADRVKVYSIGDGETLCSREICGGPHVENTSELGTFRITKEESSSAGVRRIKAVLEN